MFFDVQSRTAFGNLGWVDHGSLWCWDADAKSERRVPVSGAGGHLGVNSHGDGLVRVVHHQSNVVASIRSCGAPEIELARLGRTDTGWRFEGDSLLWGKDLALLAMQPSGQFDLLLVDGPEKTARSLDLTWFDDDGYDLGYQAPIDCLALPELGVVVVAVQRSSELVLVDVASNSVSGRISLAGRYGNPRLQALSGSTFFASDYDVLCRVDAEKGLLHASDVLQPSGNGLTAQFVGGYHGDLATVVVARPFSGDVVRLDPGTLAIMEAAQVEGEPLALCMTSDRTFVTRDWKSGRVREAAFRG